MLKNFQGDSWGLIPPLRMPSLLPHDLCHGRSSLPADNLTLHLKQLEKEEQKTPKISSKRKEIIKIKAEINEKEMKETVVKINKTKSWSSEKINKIDTPLAWIIKKKERRIKSTKLEMKKERLQETVQKYKGLQESIMNNYMAIKWITWMKWTDS